MFLIDKLIKWITEPLYPEKKEKTDLDSEINWEGNGIDVGDERWSIPTIPHNTAVHITSNRPTDFKDYIGQGKAKNILQNYLKSVKKRSMTFPHTLISGSAGTGKTTLAKIIANKLDKNLCEVIGSDFNFDIVDFIQRDVGNGILFLDEIHSVDRNTAEKFYPIMEDFYYKGIIFDPFTLIGATTELGEIIKTRKPFYDRFKIIIELEQYLEKEIKEIGKKYIERVFPEDLLENKVYMILSRNARNTPRKMIQLVEATIHYDGDYKNVLDNFNIIYKGYTHNDLKVLKYISQNEKGVGLNGISSYLGTSEENFLSMLEPYLVQNNLIVRTPRGRKITSTGIKQIKYLETKIKQGG